jgi:hypothetical protein
METMLLFIDPGVGRQSYGSVRSLSDCADHERPGQRFTTLIGRWLKTCMFFRKLY